LTAVLGGAVGGALASLGSLSATAPVAKARRKESSSNREIFLRVMGVTDLDLDFCGQVLPGSLSSFFFQWPRFYTFLGYRVSVRRRTSVAEAGGFIELYRRSKDLLHPAAGYSES
jgi:hypothetical protein